MAEKLPGSKQPALVLALLADQKRYANIIYQMWAETDCHQQPTLLRSILN